MSVADETHRVEVASWPREGAEVDLPAFWFNDDEAGQKARREAVKALARGDEASVAAGVQVQMRTPSIFREHFPLVDGKAADGYEIVLLGPGRATPVTMEIDSPAGNLALDFELRPIPFQPGAVSAFAGYAGPVLVEVNFYLLEEPTVRAAVSLHGEFSSDAATDLEVAEILLTYATQTRFSLFGEVIPASSDITGQRGAAQAGETVERQLKTRIAFYEALLYLEEQTGEVLPLPSEVTWEEIAAVEQAAETLRTGKGRTKFQRLEGEIASPAEIPELPDRFAEADPVRETMTAQVLGHTIRLGIGEFKLPKLKVVDVVAHGPSPASPARVTLEPDGDPTVDFVLVDEQTEDDNAGKGLLGD